MRVKFLTGVLASVSILTACQTVQTTAPGTVGVTREQTVSPLVNRNDLTKQANLQYAQVLSKAKEKQELNRDPAMTARVRRVADRLIPQVKVFRPEAADWKWEVNVISSKDLNAWCMPGGKIAVYSGLIQTLNLTDDELAAVMGHEIAHALREHSWERASQQANAQVGMTALAIAGSLFGVPPAALDVGSLGYSALFELPNSREHEIEADRIGVELAARAGYNPDAAVTLWQKMGKVTGNGGPPPFLSTHPSGEDRQADLRIQANKVRPLYEQAKAKN